LTPVAESIDQSPLGAKPEKLKWVNPVRVTARHGSLFTESVRVNPVGVTPEKADLFNAFPAFQ
jgi:hypothetical protein